MTTEAKIRQILVITDGCSNIGDDPVERAGKAQNAGIVVNVIGVLGKGSMEQVGRNEAMSIADAGGGMCRIVHPADLLATAQMMTHQTMQMTLQQVVSQELQSVLGKSAEDLPPEDRTRIMQVVDKLEEEVALELVVAVDMSASMKDKVATVREAIRDLSLSLAARNGRSEVAVIAFPGSTDEPVRVVQSFARDVDMRELETSLHARGGTPTGPAIDCAVELLQQNGVQPFGEEDIPRASRGFA